MSIKLIYFSSSGQSIPVLEELVNSPDVAVVGVVTKPDIPLPTRVPKRSDLEGARRGPTSKDGPTIENEIKTHALRRGLKVLTPESLKNNSSLVQELKRLDPDFIICAHYSYLIPPEILDIPQHGALNLHFSLLPAYKGPSPLEWAIAEGEKVTGITIILMSPQFDTGQIVFQAVRPINKDDTAGALYERFFAESGEIFVKVMKDMVAGEIQPWEQSADAVQTLGVKKIDVYARKGTREDSRIDWALSDNLIERRIRAFTPRPGAWTSLGELKNHHVSSSDATVSSSGLTRGSRPNPKLVKILKAHLDTTGKLEIETLQVEGKKPITWSEFERGYLKP